MVCASIEYMIFFMMQPYVKQSYVKQSYAVICEYSEQECMVHVITVINEMNIINIIITTVSMTPTRLDG